jgi:hypothetical protein
MDGECRFQSFAFHGVTKLVHGHASRHVCEPSYPKRNYLRAGGRMANANVCRTLNDYRVVPQSVEVDEGHHGLLIGVCVVAVALMIGGGVYYLKNYRTASAPSAPPQVQPTQLQTTDGAAIPELAEAAPSAATMPSTSANEESTVTQTLASPRAATPTSPSAGNSSAKKQATSSALKSPISDKAANTSAVEDEALPSVDAQAPDQSPNATSRPDISQPSTAVSGDAAVGAN